MAWLVWTVLKVIFWCWVVYIAAALVFGGVATLRENWRRVALVVIVFLGLSMLVGAVLWFSKS